MTLRSRKKRLITVRMFSRATRFSLSLLAVGIAAPAPAQFPPRRFPSQRSGATPQPYGNVGIRPAAATMLRPVPREGSHVLAPPQQHNPQHDGWNLRWRRSEHAPSPTSTETMTLDLASDPASDSGGAAATDVDANLSTSGERGTLQVATVQPELAGISQATWLTQPPQDGDALALPPDLRRENPAAPRSTGIQDFFENPFGDDPQPTRPANELTLPARNCRSSSRWIRLGRVRRDE